jgi:hypothetical protein
VGCHWVTPTFGYILLKLRSQFSHNGSPIQAVPPTINQGFHMSEFYVLKERRPPRLMFYDVSFIKVLCRTSLN